MRRVPAAADLRLEPDRSPIHEALNLAWARECIVSLESDCVTSLACAAAMPAFSCTLKADLRVSCILIWPTLLSVQPVEHEAMGDYMDKTFMFWSQSQGVQQQA